LWLFLSGHPWIVDDKNVPDKPLDSAVLSRLKHFSAMNKLKKMACRVILSHPVFMNYIKVLPYSNSGPKI